MIIRGKWLRTWNMRKNIHKDIECPECKAPIGESCVSGDKSSKIIHLKRLKYSVLRALTEGID